MTDEMRWSPDPPVELEPWLRIDLSEYANDPATARRVLEQQVMEFLADARGRCEAAANEHANLSGQPQPGLDGTVYKPIG